ncbi:polysaccharide biosynthesis C-terminal domain-containing protein, partial [bacterium]|nr:polysaccharide biosynthesis C-terminal domain-containing protein [bacterium]
MSDNRAIDLTSGNINRNLVRLSLPIMLSNFMQMFYNLTDAFWLGKLGENAKAAVSVAGITFPIIFFLASFGTGFVVAGTAIVSRYKGSNQPEKIKKTVGQYVIILILFSALYLSLSMIFLRDILTLLKVPPEIFFMANGYMRIILIGAVFMFTFHFYQSIAHGLGDTISPMIVQIIAVSLNVILDPLLIFGVGFFPRLETIGAAYATLLSRLVAAVLALIFMYRRFPRFVPEWKELIPDWHYLKII